ncbi:hypothetical protein [Streptomyces mirabilis]|uniref:hypothetical protein n=1 Tax=Streptomyces mirabilis TaxID=68239 RepID=UPI0033B33C4D
MYLHQLENPKPLTQVAQSPPLADSKKYEPSPTLTPSSPLDRGRRRRAGRRWHRRRHLGDRDARPRSRSAHAFGNNTAHVYTHPEAQADSDGSSPAIGTLEQPASVDAPPDGDGALVRAETEATGNTAPPAPRAQTVDVNSAEAHAETACTVPAQAHAHAHSHAASITQTTDTDSNTHSDTDRAAPAQGHTDTAHCARVADDNTEARTNAT